MLGGMAAAGQLGLDAIYSPYEDISLEDRLKRAGKTGLVAGGGLAAVGLGIRTNRVRKHGGNLSKFSMALNRPTKAALASSGALLGFTALGGAAGAGNALVDNTVSPRLSEEEKQRRLKERSKLGLKVGAGAGLLLAPLAGTGAWLGPTE